VQVKPFPPQLVLALLDSSVSRMPIVQFLLSLQNMDTMGHALLVITVQLESLHLLLALLALSQVIIISMF
jgi:hypothetical protein